MTATRIKICGATGPGIVRTAVDAGAHYLGLIAYPGSPRAVHPDVARLIVKEARGCIQSVAVFVDPTLEEVERFMGCAEADLVQLHGIEPPEFCRAVMARLRKPVIKSVRVRGTGMIPPLGGYDGLPLAGLLLDTYRAGTPGGTGARFAWSRAAGRIGDGRPLFVAGGLTVGNVRRAIRIFRPFAVDVSTGVELRPGLKSPEAIRRFCREVRRASA
jgi:phosphoribosylanthranilate isomerase